MEDSTLVNKTTGAWLASETVTISTCTIDMTSGSGCRMS